MDAIPELKTKGLIWHAHESQQRNADFNTTGLLNSKDFLPDLVMRKGSINEWRTQHNFSPSAFFCHLAARQIAISEDNIIWLGEDVWPSPHFLFDCSQSKDIFNKSFFLKTSSKNKLAALNYSLQTRGIGLIFTALDNLSAHILKKLSLKARDNNSVLFIFRDNKLRENNTCLLSRWLVELRPHREDVPVFNLKLSYYKGLGSNCREWLIVFRDSKPEVLEYHNNLEDNFDQEITLRSNRK